MYSSKDLERFYIQYQADALPHEESLQSFCVKNKVPYNIFQKWYKDTRKKAVEVQIDGAPVLIMEKTKLVINVNLYQKAVQTIPFVYRLTSISITGYAHPRRI